MLVNPSAQDLNYQPEVKTSVYAPPKVSIFKRIFIFLKKLFKAFRKIFAFLLLSFAVIAILIFVINYFNTISLSYLYPNVFGKLPHHYDIVANNAVLAGVPFSQNLNAYQIEGQLYLTSSDKISIKYQGKIVDFLLGSQLSCHKKTILTIDEKTQETTYETLFCSDLFSKTNYGKNVTVTYSKNASGLYLTDIEIKTP